MDKLRAYGLTALVTSVVLAGVGTWAVTFEWWPIAAISFLSILIILLAGVLYCARLLKWIVLAEGRKSRDEIKLISRALRDVNKRLQQIGAVAENLETSQEEFLVVAESKIGNLDTRIRRYLDLQHEVSDSPEVLRNRQ